MTSLSYTVEPGSRITVDRCAGDLVISSWSEPRVELRGDERAQAEQQPRLLRLPALSGSIELRVPQDAVVVVNQLHGNLRATQLAALRLAQVAGNILLDSIAGDVELETIGGNAHIQSTGRVFARARINGDVEIGDSSNVDLEAIGGNARVRGVPSVRLAWTGGNVTVDGAGERCEVGETGGNLSLHDAGNVSIGLVRGNLSLHSLTGAVSIRLVHGNVDLSGAADALELGRVNGDLNLDLDFAQEGVYRANVKGDARVLIDDQANVGVQAVVSGDIVGLGPSMIGKTTNGVFGADFGSAAARLNLHVGGDLQIDSSGVFTASWGSDYKRFTKEMNDLGREMAEIGKEIGRAFSGFWKPGGKRGRGWHGRGHGAHPGAHIAEEWFDPARFDEIKEQARKAADAGIAHAQEAVEHALGTIFHGEPPTPPAGPGPRSAPPPPRPPVAEQARPASDAERLAILRMLQEGRISPEEADLLLAALG